MLTDALEKLTRVSVCADGLSATLCVKPGIEPSEFTTEAVEAVLVSRGIRPSNGTTEAVGQLVAAMTKAPDEEASVVVARGVAAVHGQDGRFEIDQELIERSKPSGDEQGEAQGHDHYARSAFIVVEPGTRLGKVLPHTEAHDGLDVRGKVIKAKPGRPCQVRFDESVQVGVDGVVTAKQKGRLEYSEAHLKIDPVLEIGESVDFSTGNVDFPGDVLIRKGVRDCFTVHAGKDLEVEELVEASTISAEGSITLRRGMAGRGKGELRAGGDLSAKYLDGVDVAVGNDLRIERELTNCTTLVRRCVRSPSCTVVGGDLAIRFGGEVRALGGEAEAETLVRLGVDLQLEDRAKALEEVLPKILGALTRARQELETLQKSAAKLSAAQAETMTTLQFEIMTGQSRLPTIRAAIQGLLDSYQRLTRAALLVDRVISPGVTIVIADKAATVREPIRGPVVIEMDSQGGLVIRNPSTGQKTPLSAKAKIVPYRDGIDVDELRRWLDNPLLAIAAEAA
jgi:uncharacterized protein (DUF342 family)